MLNFYKDAFVLRWRNSCIEKLFNISCIDIEEEFKAR